MRSIALLLVILLAVPGAFAQTWHWLNPAPQGNNLNDCSGYWAVGDCGTVIGGFEMQPSPTTGNLIAISTVPNDAECWVACSSPASIFRSTQGGAWTRLYVDSTAYLLDFMMAAVSHGWAIGIRDDTTGFLINTTNGGQSWTERSDPRFVNARQVWNDGSETVWLTGQWPYVLRTTDAGTTWEERTVNGGGLGRLFFSDGVHGWAVHGTEIWHTEDSGETWTRQDSSNTVPLTDIAFFTNNLHGYAVGNGTILRSTDGGLHWGGVHGGPGGARLLSVSVTQEDFYPAHAVGENGTYMASSYYGTEWSNMCNNVAPGANFFGVALASNSVGYAVGWSGNTGFIMNGRMGTYDWEWSLVSTPWSEPFHDVAAADYQTAFAVSSRGGLFATHDGSTWLPQYCGVDWNLYKICFPDRNHGFILSGTDRILKTTDGGQSWSPVFIETQYGDANDMKFPDALNGWMVGVAFSDEECGNGFIYHTSDGGLTWTQQYSNDTICVNACDFHDALTGWAVGSYGTILKTTDGGQNWILKCNSSVGEYLSIVNFPDAYHGYVTGGGGSYLYSDDAGESWQQRPLPTLSTVSAINFRDATYGWAVGNNGLVLECIGATTGISGDRQPSMPAAFSLSAYPNPFNPTTVLAFDVPRSGRVTLSVYDLTGRLVQTLTDRGYPQGNYRINFDGSNLSSGIYFARLQGKSFSKTQKLVLLK